MLELPFADQRLHASDCSLGTEAEANGRRVDLRGIRDLEDRLEAHALVSDGCPPRLGMRSLLAGADPAQAADIGFVQGPARIGNPESRIGQLETNAGRPGSRRHCVVRVLEKFVDEAAAIVPGNLALLPNILLQALGARSIDIQVLVPDLAEQVVSDGGHGLHRSLPARARHGITSTALSCHGWPPPSLLSRDLKLFAGRATAEPASRCPGRVRCKAARPLVSVLREP